MTENNQDSESTKSRLVVEEAEAGQRLDVYVLSMIPKMSRVKIGRLINKEQITVKGRASKPSYRVRLGDEINVTIPPPEPMGSLPEDIELDILHEDDDVIAVNKPAAMVVHPAKGNWSGTLTAALTFHFSQLSTIGGDLRPGIVHRLDRDTTGVIIVAKNDAAHMHLTKQFELRTVEKEYLAIVSPAPDRDRDWVRAPIGVHPYQREKMAVRDGHRTSRNAETFYEVIERFRGFALVKASPKTGRTHQIRIHLTHAGAPVLCDRLYSGRSRITRSMIQATPVNEEDDSVLLDRQALHAHRIGFEHPVTGEMIRIEAPLPPDMQRILDVIRENRTSK